MTRRTNVGSKHQSYTPSTRELAARLDAPTQQGTIRIDDVRIGSRHRRDLGDIVGLAASIVEVGLLHPIVIRPDGTLIAGERRLRAAESLGWTEIPVNIVDVHSVVRGEFAENAHRKNFTPSELVAVGQELEDIERARAKTRMVAAHVSPGNLPEQDKGDARDKIAGQLGVSGRTYEKARTVCQAADQNPVQCASIREQMDATGNVDRAFRQVQRIARQEEHANHTEHGCTVADLVALADSGQRFSVIYADPPWPFATWAECGKGRSLETHYSTSPLDEIMKLPVAALAADDCALLLWCTGPHIAIGSHVKVIEAWGFRPSTVAFDWIKQEERGDGLHVGMGYWSRANSEQCFIATKGSPRRLATDVHQVVTAPVGEHSAKPEEVRARIERLLPGPYLELYGRKLVPNWTVGGNEIPSTLEAPSAAAVVPNTAAHSTDDLGIPQFLRRVP